MLSECSTADMDCLVAVPALRVSTVMWRQPTITWFVRVCQPSVLLHMGKVWELALPWALLQHAHLGA